MISPSKKREHQVSDELHKLISQIVVTICCWNETCPVIPQGEDSWKLVPGLLRTSLHAPFPLTHFLLDILLLYIKATSNTVCESCGSS